MSKLRDEIKQRKVFHSLEEEVFLNILRTHDQLLIKHTRLLRPYGLTQPQYNILRILRGAGEPLPCLEVADRMITVVPAITRLIDQLEKQEYALRTRSLEDRRVVLTSITKRGLKALKALDDQINALDQSLLKHLTRTELKQLSKLLEKARDMQAS
jgi:DNA-binding MarR family transcriptional regulator